ncbi:MAG: copper chaperone PCu(A)C [Rhodobacteraceae bacterium]|nr:copper chaperone PCu(A)C [Paracoccaceae bacterium]
MTRIPSLLAAALAVPLALSAAFPALAGDITVTDAYARSSGMSARSGAAFMVIANAGAEDDRVIAASAAIAERVELHTHLQDANGVMRMVEVEDGFAIPAHSSHALARGGDHVMFLGLTGPMEQGARFPLVLTFEKAGEVTVDVTVDLERKPDHGKMGMQGHGAMSHSN